MVPLEANISGVRFAVGEGVVVVEEDNIAFLRIREITHHTRKDRLAVKLMTHRYGESTQMNWYAEGESGDLSRWMSFAFNEVCKNSCVLSLDGRMNAYCLNQWTAAIASGEIDWGFPMVEPEVICEEHRTVYRGFKNGSQILIGNTARPEYVIDGHEVQRSAKKLIVHLHTKDGRSEPIELEKGVYHPLDDQTSLRVGFVYPKSVELDVETSKWNYRPDEWLSRLLNKRRFSVNTA